MDDKNFVRNIPWREWFPWTLIFRSLPVAVSVPAMVLALVGVLLTPAGWKISQLIFIDEAYISAEDPAFAEFITRVGSPHEGIVDSASDESLISLFGYRIAGPKLVFTRFAEPFWRMFRQYNGLSAFLYLLVGCVWTAVVWSFVGTAIARIAALRYTRNESIGIDDAALFAWSRFPSSVMALLLPLAGVLGLCLFTFLAGLLMTIDFGLLIVSIFYFVILALAFVMAIILLGLAFGWPLTMAAMGTEGQDSFDAMTRSYAYTFQRPVNYAFYAIVAIIFGGLCWLVVARVTEGVENLSFWSTSWGANVRADRIEIIRDPTAAQELAATSSAGNVPAVARDSGMLKTSRVILGFWLSFLKSVAVAFLFAHFWCMATAIYLLLRRDVDETELDEVYVTDEQRTYDLPSLAATAPSASSSARGEAETQARDEDDGN